MLCELLLRRLKIKGATIMTNSDPPAIMVRLQNKSIRKLADVDILGPLPHRIRLGNMLLAYTLSNPLLYAVFINECVI